MKKFNRYLLRRLVTVNIVVVLLVVAQMVTSVYINWRTIHVGNLNREMYYNTLTGSILEHYFTQGESCSFKTVKSLIKAIDKVLPEALDGTPFKSEDLLAIAALESGFDMSAVGKHGERGCFQILNYRSVLKEINCPIANPLDPEINTKMACYVLKNKWLQRKDYRLAIISYNGYIVKDGKVVERYWKMFKEARDLIEDLKYKARGI